MELLTQKLKALATDGNKHRAKVDKRKQRSVFRDVLRAVEVLLIALNILICKAKSGTQFIKQLYEHWTIEKLLQF